MRRFVRRLRYGLRDLLAAAFPGRTERRRIALAAAQMAQRASGARDPAWRDALPAGAAAPDATVGLVAFYAADPDRFAGAEGAPDCWARVQNARPQFLGHVQPHLSGALGAYDPGAEATLRQQVALARAYGITAFCFAVHWDVAGVHLPAPLKSLLAAPDILIGFCLAVTGEGGAGPMPDPLQQALTDPRAVRVDGRPLVILGTSDVLGPKTGSALRLFGAEASAAVFKVEPFVGQTRLGPGMDAAVQVAPHAIPPVGTPRRIEPVYRDFTGRVDEQAHLGLAAMAQAKAADVPVFAGVCAGYDDTAVRGRAARILVAGDPADAFARWLSEAAFFAADRPVAGARLVFVSAWNDWPNGAYLEPDARLGHALLRAAASTLAPYAAAPIPAPPAPAPAPLPRARPPADPAANALVIHAFYPDLLPPLLAELDLAAPLFVTAPPDRERQVRDVLVQHAPHAHLRVFANRGRDVRPFLALLPELQAVGVETVLKLHTKRSPHHGGKGADWMAQLSRPLTQLQRTGALAAAFQARPDLGMLGAAGHVLDGAAFAGIAGNTAWIHRLSRDLALRQSPQAYGFVAGTMFAARLSVFSPLLERPDFLDLFEPEMGLTDGTLAHACERFFGLMVEAAGLTLGTVGQGPAGALEIIPAARPVTQNYGFAPGPG